MGGRMLVERLPVEVLPGEAAVRISLARPLVAVSEGRGGFRELTCDTNVWRTVGVTARPTVAVFMRFMLTALSLALSLPLPLPLPLTPRW